MRKLSEFFTFLLAVAFTSCQQPVKEVVIPIENISENYIKLALSIGQIDPDFVDAYYGPEEFKPPLLTSDTTDIPFEELKWKAMKLHMMLEELDISKFDSTEVLRYRYLVNQINAIKTKLEIISGEVFPFDVESRSLYDAVAPTYKQEYFDKLLLELDYKLPGRGSFSARYDAFINQFIIPEDKLDTVFQVAIEEARKRTAAHIDLPEGENFTFEYVTDKPWTGYNWYQGNAISLIQINIDFPMTIDKAIHLACHEGYPGHHVYNSMLEKHLVNERGWQEFSIYPLFSPQSLIAEGSANFGVDVAFSKADRRKFEKEVLFPLAGLDPSKVDLYYDIQELKSKLSYSDNIAAKQYLDGQMSKEDAIQWLMKFNLMTSEHASQRIEFYNRYRSYVINYNYGRDIIQDYVVRNGGVESNPEKRWELFEEILTNPLTASMIE